MKTSGVVVVKYNDVSSLYGYYVEFAWDETLATAVFAKPETQSPAAYGRHIASVVRSLRGTEVSFDHLASCDDHVYARVTVDGFNLATEKPLHVIWLAQYRIADGRIAEAWTLHRTDLGW